MPVWESRRMKRYKTLLKFSIYGFCAGTLLSSAYVLFGPWGWNYWPDPLWARIVLFPGIVAGYLVYDAGRHSVLACQIVGVAIMGIVAAMMGGGWAVVIGVWKRRQAH